ncbi:MAG: proton-conducting transporter membrane subunit [Campylobacterota bacterium]
MLAAYTLLFSPFLMALFYLFLPRYKTIFTIACVGILTILSAYLFISSQTLHLSFLKPLHFMFIALDFALLLYFFYEGIRYKNPKIYLLALMQFVLFIAVVLHPSHATQPDMIIDNLSVLMFFIINIVGGIIIIYALQYIQSESFSPFKKSSFIAVLFGFLGVMNFIVSANLLELFFLGFELTTLCSYILIKYRGDVLSVDNAKKALWMNQIGGVFILIALVYAAYGYEVHHFSTLLHSSHTLLFAFSALAVAALVKGASFPFYSWLLGAMAAPTPVSAMLHSATMVKIAPFLILKLSSGFDATLSILIALLGSFVFVIASLFAFSKDYIKEILGYSTIALLGLMIALAAIDLPSFHQAAITLIVFHAISKGLLFLHAGVLEKEFGIKYLSQIQGLSNKAPLLVFSMAVAFASLTLPPFGVFVGKFLAIESFASLLQVSILYLPILLFTILGSVILTVLYFRVLSNLYAKENTQSGAKAQLPKLYITTLGSFTALLFLGIVQSIFVFNSVSIILTLGVFGVFVLGYLFYRFKDVDRTGVYHCGENDSAQLSSYYFDFETKFKQPSLLFATALIGFIIIWGIYV